MIDRIVQATVTAQRWLLKKSFRTIDKYTTNKFNIVKWYVDTYYEWESYVPNTVLNPIFDLMWAYPMLSLLKPNLTDLHRVGLATAKDKTDTIVIFRMDIPRRYIDNWAPQYYYPDVLLHMFLAWHGIIQDYLFKNKAKLLKLN